MKSSIRFFTGLIFAFGLLGWLSLVFASQSIASGKSPSNTSIMGYSYKALGPSISLKWPRGSLIFPESNDPSRTNEVFLLSEDFTSQTELQSLHHHLGLQFFSRRKYSEAKSEYLKALKIKPDIPAIHKNLGMIYFNSKSYRRAEKAYRKALQKPGVHPRSGQTGALPGGSKKICLGREEIQAGDPGRTFQCRPPPQPGAFLLLLKEKLQGSQNLLSKSLEIESPAGKGQDQLEKY